jgi:prepilin-type N-terminal cleavage/methylation domain-containing protein
MNDRGFSLTEVMVAIVILAVGVIALAASAGAITRMTTQGGRTGGASSVAASRIEILRGTPCASLASGNTTTGRYAVRWVVSTVNTNLRTATVQVSYNAGTSARSATFSTQISCAPAAQ